MGGAVELPWVALEGAVNFRDLGGLPVIGGGSVRTGVLFRSDSLHALTTGDIDVLAELGLRTVYDLRKPSEVRDLGVGALFDDPRITRVHVPIFETEPAHWLSAPPYESGRDVAAVYIDMLELGAASIRRVVNGLLRDDPLPAVFHCVAGRDRTGTVAAVLLSAVGVPDDAIARDYALTEVPIPVPAMLSGAMEALLEHIERTDGSAAALVNRLVGRDVTADLTALLAEESPEPGSQRSVTA